MLNMLNMLQLQEDPPVDVLSSGPYTAHTAPSGARGAPGTAGSTTADTADEVPAVPSAAPALARRSWGVTKLWPLVTCGSHVACAPFIVACCGMCHL